MSSTSISISQLLRKTEHVFSETDIPLPHLDAEVLLAHVLGVDRSYLHAHPNYLLHGATLQEVEMLVERRVGREPVAYITGKKEFYGRDFIVTPDVLIPRPETEYLVDLTLRSLKQGSVSQRILDIGCGSGCVGITLKLERPEIDVTLSDISSKALYVAKENAKKLGAKVEFVQSDLLKSFSKIQNPKSKIFFNAIVANLPYVDKTWQRSPETDHEPALALFADDHGLKLIKKLTEQSTTILAPNGYLLLEADPEQHDSIILYATQHEFSLVTTLGYGLSFVKKP